MTRGPKGGQNLVGLGNPISQNELSDAFIVGNIRFSPNLFLGLLLFRPASLKTSPIIPMQDDLPLKCPFIYIRKWNLEYRWPHRSGQWLTRDVNF